MALQLLTLVDMQAYSALAEVQALTDQTLEVFESIAINLLESELSRRITLDTVDVEREVAGSGMKLVSLPERLDSITSIEMDYGVAGDENLVNITTDAKLRADGWLLKFYTYHITDTVYITGRWGFDPPQQVLDVLMDLCEALAVRGDDTISRRNEVSSWGDVNDGALRASRNDTYQNRKPTAENLLRYDLKLRLKPYYRPTRWEFI